MLTLHVIAMLTLHVDDVMIAGDGPKQSESVIHPLHQRFPFGEWSVVAKKGRSATVAKKFALKIRQKDFCSCQA